MSFKNPYFIYSEEVSDNLQSNQAVVALESTVLTHGLPFPQNYEVAIAMENIIRSNGACPATIAILEGKIHIGLTSDQIEILINQEAPRKVSLRDFSSVIVKKEWGGTTVAGTLFVANKAGIKVFSTGGIGGVHPNSNMDVSADLTALSKYPVIVVCAGAKAILDLPATLEVLETNSVPIIGYKTDEFPAFYSADSGLPVSLKLDNPKEIIDYANTHWQLGFSSSILVAAAPPPDSAIPSRQILEVIKKAQKEAEADHIRGQELTPYILSKLSYLTDGATLRSNIDLLVNNAEIGSQIAIEFAKRELFTD